MVLFSYSLNTLSLTILLILNWENQGLGQFKNLTKGTQC